LKSLYGPATCTVISNKRCISYWILYLVDLILHKQVMYIRDCICICLCEEGWLYIISVYNFWPDRRCYICWQCCCFSGWTRRGSTVFSYYRRGKTLRICHLSFVVTCSRSFLNSTAL